MLTMDSFETNVGQAPRHCDHDPGPLSAPQWRAPDFRRQQFWFGFLLSFISSSGRVRHQTTPEITQYGNVTKWLIPTIKNTSMDVRLVDRCGQGSLSKMGSLKTLHLSGTIRLLEFVFAFATITKF